MANIICMKWGTKYGPEFVNRLRSMVRRHLKRPHRFVCFTDDATGLDADIECLPLPPMDLPPGKERGWRKLSTFCNPLADLSGPTLFLDIDIVIVGPLDDFFDHPGEFCIIHDWVRPWRITGNSSVYRFEAGAHPEVLSYFLANIDRVKSEVRNEQEYLSREIHRQKKAQLLAEGMVRELQVRLHPDLSAQLLQGAAHPGRCARDRLPRPSQPRRSRRRQRQGPAPSRAAYDLD